MKTVWFVMFILFAVAVFAFYKQDEIKQRIGIEKPDSELGKKVDEAMGLNRVQHLDRARRVGTEAEFSSIRTAFVMYYTLYGEHPRSLEDLISKGMIDRNAMNDFWRQGYRTTLEGTELVLTSPGPDRIMNTQDDIVTRIPLMEGGSGVEWSGTTAR